MAQRIPLAVAVVCAALFSIACSASIIVSFLSRRRFNPADAGVAPLEQPQRQQQAAERARLLPAQRLQLLLAFLDIGIAVVSAASLQSIVFQGDSTDSSPFVDAQTTLALSLCLLLRPALICAFAGNSAASIWTERSISSERWLFLPPALSSLAIAAICAVALRVYDHRAYDSGMTTGQAAVSALVISCLSLLGVASTLAISGIIWAVWTSRQQQRNQKRHRQRQQHRAQFRKGNGVATEAIELKAEAKVQQQRLPSASPNGDNNKRTEFGVMPTCDSAHTFGQVGPATASLDTGKRISQALDGTLCLSQRTTTTAAATSNVDGPHAGGATLASSLDPYDAWSDQGARPVASGDAGTQPQQQQHQVARSPRGAHDGDFSIRYTYVGGFDATLTSDVSQNRSESETSRPESPLPAASSGFAVISRARRTESGESHEPTSRKASLRSRRSILLSRVRSSGFVLLDADDVRREVAMQGFDISCTVETERNTRAQHGFDVEKGAAPLDRQQQQQQRRRQRSSQDSFDTATTASLDRTEALKALARLTGLIVVVWLPFPLSLPYLTKGWTQGAVPTKTTTDIILLCLALTLTPPLMVLQRIVTYLLEKRARTSRMGSDVLDVSSDDMARTSSCRDRERTSYGSCSCAVAGVGFGDCNGYDHGVALLRGASCARSRDLDIARASARPARFSSADTFGAARNSPSASVQHGLGAASRQRNGSFQSSISANSMVPFANEHWAGKRIGAGDCIEPRSPFWRAVNLLLSPHPKLELLPQDDDHSCRHAFSSPRVKSGADLVPSTPRHGVIHSVATPQRYADQINEVDVAEKLLPLPSRGLAAWNASDATLSETSAMEAEERQQLELMLEPDSLLSPHQRTAETPCANQDAHGTEREIPLKTVSFSSSHEGGADKGRASMSVGDQAVSASQRDGDTGPEEEHQSGSIPVHSDYSSAGCMYEQEHERKRDGGCSHANDDDDIRIARSETSDSQQAKRPSRRTISPIGAFPHDMDDSPPGQARQCRTNFSPRRGISLPSPADSSNNSSKRGSLRSIGNRAMSSFHDSSLGQLIGQVSPTSSNRHKMRSVISEAMSLDSPSYVGIDERDAHCNVELHDTCGVFRGDGDRSNISGASASNVGHALSLQDELVTRRAEEDGEEGKKIRGDKSRRSERRSSSIASDISQTLKSKLSLARSLGLGNSSGSIKNGSKKRSSTPSRQTLLGESMGLQAMPKRPLSTELGLDDVAPRDAGEDDDALADTTCAVEAERPTTADDDATGSTEASFTRGHQRQDTIGSISLLSSCMSEEIVISPDPSPQKPREVEVVGWEPEELGRIVVMQSDYREPLQTVIEEDEGEEEEGKRGEEGENGGDVVIATEATEGHARDDEEDGDGEQMALARDALSFFREQFPVRILSPVLEATEDETCDWTASNSGGLSRVTSLLSLSPASASRRSVADTPLREDWASRCGVQRSLTLGSPSKRATRPRRAAMSPGSAQRLRLLAQQVQRSPERRLSQLLRGTVADEASPLASPSSTLAPATPTRTETSRRLSELSFDDSIWRHSPLSLVLRTSPDEWTEPSQQQQVELEKVSLRGDRRAEGEGDTVQTSMSPSGRGGGTKRRSTTSLQLLASSGASAVTAWKDMRLRHAGTDATTERQEKRRSLLSTPFEDLRCKLRKLERRSSILKGSNSNGRSDDGGGGGKGSPKKAKKSRGRVAVMTDRHHFCVVDGDDSFVKVMAAAR